MSKEILYVADSIANEKGVEREVICSAIEAALEMATKKKYREDVDIKVTIDSKTGDSQTERVWTVIDDAEAEDGELEFPDKQILLSEALVKNPDIKAGELILEIIPTVEFGRISAQAAKQVIVQKVREAERMKIAESYKERIGDILFGTVRRVTRDYLIVEITPQADAILHREDLVAREHYRVGDRIRAVLKDVDENGRGPQLRLSRTDPRMLIGLFKIEVPEISEEVIEIMGAARDSGVRAKIAVKTSDGRIDPIGACVGMRGSRVQSVSTELQGEKIDIILWDPEPVQYVINAMAPAEIKSIIVNEDTHSMKLTVEEDQLSQAIGRGGQNINLAGILTGWKLDVSSGEEEVPEEKTKSDDVLALFMEKLDVEQEIADILVAEGFKSLDEVAYVDESEMADIEEFGEEIAAELQNRAKNALLKEALELEETYKGAQPAEDLLSLAGMEKELAYKLAQNDVKTREDLAEQSVDELGDIVPDLDKEKAAALIMEARKSWFE